MGSGGARPGSGRKRVKPDPLPRLCARAGCGVTFAPKRGCDGQRFCSCRCGALVVQGSRRGPRGGIRHTVRACRLCQAAFAPRYQAQVFCSRACGAQHGRQTGVLQRADFSKRWRVRKKEYHRLRGRRLQRLIREICERDHWVCHICSNPIESSIAVRRAESPTVDHVIPLARGGTDDVANLKAAHWLCNMRKGTKIGWKAVA